MEILDTIASIGVVATAMILTIGLIRPGFVVWWNQANSRKQVIMVWGSLFIIFAIFYFITNGSREDQLKGNDGADQEIEVHTQGD